jgi:ABC-type lipoprotein release transport system permease subunit
VNAPRLPAAATFLALRYLLSRWVNVLGMAGVAVAVWALILVPAVFSGFIAEIRQHARDATADLTVTFDDEQQSYEAVRPLLEADADVAATAPRLQHYAILFPNGAFQVAATINPVDPTPARFNFVVLIGVDPERERTATGFAGWLAQPEPPVLRVEDPSRPFEVRPGLVAHGHALRGSPVDPEDLLGPRDGIVLPARRLRGLGLDPGQFVDVVSARFLRRAGKEQVKKIRASLAIAGGFETKHRTFDEFNSFVHVETLRGLLGHDPQLPGSVDVVSEVAIRARPGADLAGLAARLQQRLHAAADPRCVVRTWEQVNAVFLGAVDQERALMRLVLFAVMLVAAFLIYATLHMMVTQKTKDIGILCAMGASPNVIATLFTLCGAIVGVVGCTLGLVAGSLSAVHLNDVNEFAREHWQRELFPTHLYNLKTIPYRLEPPWLAFVLCSALGLALLVAWLPARRAARLDPVQTLNYE